MEIQFYKPKNTILKQLLKGYYFFTENINPKPIKYWTFPNNYSILSVKQDADTILTNNKLTIVQSSQKKITANLIFHYNCPIQVYYEKPVNEITILFNPLSLNYFVNCLSIFSARKNIIGYEPFSDFKSKMDEIFKTPYREAQIEQLENYWISKLSDKNFSLMEKFLSDIESDLKVDEIAKKYNYTRQYLNKLFLKNIGKTPSEYRKIHRFRRTLTHQKECKNLTNLAHQQLFFDQAHFIKDFKELTNLKPGTFFKKVDTGKEIVWFFT